MIIWLSLLIPFIGAFIMLRWFREYLAWWEVTIPLLACIIFTLVFKFTVEKIQTTDTEYWSALVQKAEYYEPYTTWVKRICSRTIKVGKTSSTIYYDCSYCDENGPDYKVVNDLGESFYVRKSFYDELQKRWNATPRFVELNRDIRYHGTCGVDGDKYVIYWNRKPETAEQTVSSHYYENRIQAAHTAFSFPVISEEDKKSYKLFDYPEINDFSQKVLLGDDSIPWLTQAEKNYGRRILEYCSGYWGPKKKGKIFVLFFKDSPHTSSLMQEAYWDGGNDNDLVICIGLSSKSRDLQWTKVFSWTPNRTILVDLREDIMNLKTLNFKGIQEAIDKRMVNFKRKDFKEFSYVTVEPPTWAIIVTYLVTILLTIGLCYWAIINEFVTNEEEIIKRIDRKILEGSDRIKSKWNALISKIKNIRK